MAKELSRCGEIEHTIQTTYRRKIWTPFVKAIKDFNLIKKDDKIAVCISGGKDSMLMAKLFQMFQKISNVPFEIVYLVMNPGYNDVNLNRIVENAKTLEIPITVFDTKIFDATQKMEKTHVTCVPECVGDTYILRPKNLVATKLLWDTTTPML